MRALLAALAIVAAPALAHAQTDSEVTIGPETNDLVYADIDTEDNRAPDGPALPGNEAFGIQWSFEGRFAVFVGGMLTVTILTLFMEKTLRPSMHRRSPWHAP